MEEISVFPLINTAYLLYNPNEFYIILTRWEIQT